MQKVFEKAQSIWENGRDIPNQYAWFLHEFELRNLENVVLNISVDNRYTLYINGNLLNAQQYADYAAAKQIKCLAELGYNKIPVCIAKTQYSFSDDPTLLGAPEGFTVTVRDVTLSAGAGFIVVLTGNIITMPGLPKVPAAEKIDIDENGKITGLF